MDFKIEDLLKRIAELETQLAKALIRIEELEKENKELKLENAELKAKLGMNSSNSSLPPSSDKFIKKKERNRSLRKKSGKASGGQIGHKGSTLEKVNNPDFVIELPHDVCPHCAASLKDMIDTGQEIDEKTELNDYLEYVCAIEKGYEEEKIHFPFDNTKSGKGRIKRSKAFNLLERLSRYEDVLTFFTERNSSLFTNNAAEREIRNVKIKSKVQGAFRSDLGSEIYCRVRGYIATMKKNGHNQYRHVNGIMNCRFGGADVFWTSSPC